MVYTMPRRPITTPRARVEESAIKVSGTEMSRANPSEIPVNVMC